MLLIMVRPMNSSPSPSSVWVVQEGFPAEAMLPRWPHPSSLQLEWGISLYEIDAQKSLWTFLLIFSQGPIVSFFSCTHFSSHSPLLESSSLLRIKGLVPWDLSHSFGGLHQPFPLGIRGGAGLGSAGIRAQLKGDSEKRSGALTLNSPLRI